MRDEGTARVVELAALSALSALGCIVAAGLADLSCSSLSLARPAQLQLPR
jgi:hypothetical protein